MEVVSGGQWLRFSVAIVFPCMVVGDQSFR